MKFLSHRGLWSTKSEQNTKKAFERSFQQGFGIETDLRDHGGEIVVSHDMPSGNEITLNELLECYCCFSKELTLALNIKADGLQKGVKSALDAFAISNYFVFDMSIPDTILYKYEQIRFFTRVSEYEPVGSILEGSSGIWLDAFEQEWFSKELVKGMIEKGLEVAIVSSELHGRPHREGWSMLKEANLSDKTYLCTDFPDEARSFFNDKN